MMRGRPRFSELQQLVAEGKLSITFVLGLARGGTTAIEKHLHRALHFDANVNEPTLSGPEACWEVGATGGGDDDPEQWQPLPGDHEDPDADDAAVVRWEEATFEQVLRIVKPLVAEREQLQQQQQQQQQQRRRQAGRKRRRNERWPVRVIVKEVTNKVLPSTIPLWGALSDAAVVVVRNPLLQLESRLKSILDRVGSGALAAFGLHDDRRADEFLTIDGAPILRERRGDRGAEREGSSSSSSSSSNSSNSSSSSGGGRSGSGETWGQEWRRMKRNRDFSRLSGDGLARVSALHPFCAKRPVQQAVWGHFFGGNSQHHHHHQTRGTHGTHRHEERTSEHQLGRCVPGAEGWRRFVGIPLGAFSAMPQPLSDAILDWRLGWTPLEVQLPLLRQAVADRNSGGAAGKEEEDEEEEEAAGGRGLPRERKVQLMVVDFSCYQIDPFECAVERLRRALRPFWGSDEGGDEDDGEEEEAEEEEEGDAFAVCSAEAVVGRSARCEGTPEQTDASGGGGTSSSSSSSSSSLSSSSSSSSSSTSLDRGVAQSRWNAWYGQPCFSRVVSSREVDPVAKTPIAARDLPPSLVLSAAHASSPSSDDKWRSAHCAWGHTAGSAVGSADAGSAASPMGSPMGSAVGSADAGSVLRHAFAVYVDLVSDPSAAAPPLAKHDAFRGVDGLHDALWCDLRRKAFANDKEIGIGGGDHDYGDDGANYDDEDDKGNVRDDKDDKGDVRDDKDAERRQQWRMDMHLFVERTVFLSNPSSSSSSSSSSLSMAKALPTKTTPTGEGAATGAATRGGAPTAAREEVDSWSRSARAAAAWLERAVVAALLCWSLSWAAVQWFLLNLHRLRAMHQSSAERIGVVAKGAAGNSSNGSSAAPTVRRRPLVSVIIPAYNEAACIATTLAAVARCRSGADDGDGDDDDDDADDDDDDDASPRIDVEVIVVDGGCTDDTRRVVERIAKSADFATTVAAPLSSSSSSAGAPVGVREPSLRTPLRLVRSSGGRGPALAAGVAAVSEACDVIVFLHADTVLPRGYDRLLVDSLLGPRTTRSTPDNSGGGDGDSGGDGGGDGGGGGGGGGGGAAEGGDSPRSVVAAALPWWLSWLPLRRAVSRSLSWVVAPAAALPVAMVAFRFMSNRSQLQRYRTSTSTSRGGGAGTTAAAAAAAMAGFESASLPVGLGLLELGVQLRSACFEMPYGDQGLALTPAALREAGGVPLLPMLEDYELVLRVRRHVGRILTLGAAPAVHSQRRSEHNEEHSEERSGHGQHSPPANERRRGGGRRGAAPSDGTSLTSPRRYEEMGVWRACLANQLVLLAYALGASADRIYGWYYHGGGGGVS